MGFGRNTWYGLVGMVEFGRNIPSFPSSVKVRDFPGGHAGSVGISNAGQSGKSHSGSVGISSAGQHGKSHSGSDFNSHMLTIGSYGNVWDIRTGCAGQVRISLLE